MSFSSVTVLGAIPSPSDGELTIGPLSLHAYGLMIALGVIAAVWVTGRRFEQRGIGQKEDVSNIAVWGVIGGIIGARIYHVLTDWKSFRGDWLRAFKIWEGGLGIWGGIALGIVTGLYGARRRKIPLGPALVCAVPSLPLAQAFGRLGNWFNQELYGKPTDLPWKLKITKGDAPGFYHPTFLYELLWNVGLFGLLMWLDRRRNMKPGRMLAWYVAGYTVGRFWIESLRIDKASKVFGLRINLWVSMILFAIAALYLLATRGQTAPQAEELADTTTDDDLTDMNDFNAKLIEEFRANDGVVTGHFAEAPLILITHKGAKSGIERTTPLVYSLDGERIVLIASKGGAPAHPHWYFNMVVNPTVTVELPGETFEASVTEVEGDERRRLFDAQAELMPNFKDYEAQAGDRTIPVLVLERT